MNVEHRRQLLAFFVVAFAALLLIGNTLHNQLRDAINGRSDTPSAIATVVTISPGQSRVDSLGGSARGTTATEPVRVPVTSVQTSGGTSTARSTAPARTTPGQSDQARKAQLADQKSNASAQKRASEPTTKRSARAARSDSLVAARTGVTVRGLDKSSSSHGKKAHGKKAHGKKHRHHRR